MEQLGAINFDNLKKEQIKLSKKIILKDELKDVRKVGGIDQAYIQEEVISCIIVCDCKTGEIIERQTAVAKAPILYKPGFLAYRELPAMVEAYNKLTTIPDVVIVDGHGIAHPRRLGIASHFGLVMNVPTIGVAEHVILGKIEKGKIYIEKTHVGCEVRTKEHARPIYVSPGHMISIGTAVRIVLETTKEPHKLPEPLHWAHRGARKEMKRLLEEKEGKTETVRSKVSNQTSPD